MSEKPTRLDISDEMIAERRGSTGKMPDDMPKWMAKSIILIDKFSKWTGNIVCWILMPLILAVYVGVFTVIEDPHGTVSTVFSFIPLTSPVVMLMRIPFGVPIWQQLLSIVLLIGTFSVTVWFAAKIYRVGILMFGKKPTYRELFKWLKY